MFESHASAQSLWRKHAFLHQLVCILCKPCWRWRNKEGSCFCIDFASWTVSDSWPHPHLSAFHTFHFCCAQNCSASADFLQASRAVWLRKGHSGCRKGNLAAAMLTWDFSRIWCRMANCASAAVACVWPNTLDLPCWCNALVRWNNCLKTFAVTPETKHRKSSQEWRSTVSAQTPSVHSVWKTVNCTVQTTASPTAL